MPLWWADARPPGANAPPTDPAPSSRIVRRAERRDESVRVVPERQPMSKLRSYRGVAAALAVTLKAGASPAAAQQQRNLFTWRGRA